MCFVLNNCVNDFKSPPKRANGLEEWILLGKLFGDTSFQSFEAMVVLQDLFVPAEGGVVLRHWSVDLTSSGQWLYCLSRGSDDVEGAGDSWQTAVDCGHSLLLLSGDHSPRICEACVIGGVPLPLRSSSSSPTFVPCYVIFLYKRVSFRSTLRLLWGIFLYKSVPLVSNIPSDPR